MLLFLSLFVVVGGVAAQGGQANEGQKATAELKDKDGQVVGTATLTQQANGVRIQAQVTGLEPGLHGIHVHTVGKCDPPDFSTAGGHFNPTAKQHGLQNPAGPHAGDAPNLQVGADRKGTFDYLDTAITFAAGAPANIFDVDGAALVIHASADDEKTDPAGNSGARIACGVISLAANAPAQLPTTGGAPVSGGLVAALGLTLALVGLGLRRELSRA